MGIEVYHFSWRIQFVKSTSNVHSPDRHRSHYFKDKSQIALISNPNLVYFKLFTIYLKISFQYADIFSDYHYYCNYY